MYKEKIGLNILHVYFSSVICICYFKWWSV